MNKRIRLKLKHRLGYRTWKGCKNKPRLDPEFDQLLAVIKGINSMCRGLEK